jgi:predicted nucleic acid-binding protein
VLVPQCLYEFYSVVTRPAHNNGLGISPSDAVEIVNDFLDVMPLLRDERMVFHHWLTLVSDYEVQGKQSHDTRLVAAMDRHQVNTLITFNIGDFQRFTHITVVSPSDIVAKPR